MRNLARIAGRIQMGGEMKCALRPAPDAIRGAGLVLAMGRMGALSRRARLAEDEWSRTLLRSADSVSEFPLCDAALTGAAEGRR